MTNTITTSAFDQDWSVLWWLLVPFLLGLVTLIIGGVRRSEDTMYAGAFIVIFVSVALFMFIAPTEDHDQVVEEISAQLHYSEVDYESNMQFTAKDEEGYYLKCAVFDTDEKNTYEVVCTK